MRRILQGNMYKGIYLGDYDKNSLGYYLEILERLENLYRYMVLSHYKVFVVTLEINLPSEISYNYQGDNTHVRNLAKAIWRRYSRNGYDPGYVWVREVSPYGHTHYHMVLLLNGNLIQNAQGIRAKADILWNSYFANCHSGGAVHFCRYGGDDDKYLGIKIRRNDPNFQQVYEECFRRASYLAKVYSKGNAPAYVNEYGYSRVPSLG